MGGEYLLVADPGAQTLVPTQFWLRMAENFFRRWYLYLVPVLIMGAIGVAVAGKTESKYEVSAVLSTASNPLVGEPDIRGTSLNSFESTAQGTARIINEQLDTDAFLGAVAAQAGLGDVYENGSLTTENLRKGVGAEPLGENLVAVFARWDDSQTGIRLVEATIAEYSDLLRATVTEDAQTAVDFYEDRKVEAETRADDAAVDYDLFLQSLPSVTDGADVAFSDQLQLARLDERLSAADSARDDAEDAIAAAKLTVVQAQSEAGRSLRVIDPPEAPDAPDSTARTRIALIGAFLVLGLIIGGTALAFASWLDRSVRTIKDVQTVGGVGAVAVIPHVRALSPRRWRRRAGSAAPPW